MSPYTPATSPTRPSIEKRLLPNAGDQLLSTLLELGGRNTVKNRYPLLQRGLFPETLPPCFTSMDLKKGFSGLVRSLKAKALHNKRHTDYVRYNGTKHDGSRRYFGTPNPISYFYVASFIAENWEAFEDRFSRSPFSVSKPSLGRETDDRPIVIQSLSELSTAASTKLRHAAYVMKTDIAQFFPSIYTHSISWSAHGIDAAKADQAVESANNVFNRLDFFTRNCQLAETRGILVGPDAFRLIAEFISAGLDVDIYDRIQDNIVGAARHVDDYFIGLRGEPEALVALSALRDVLQRYSLNINDSKTKIMKGVEPLNDVWAQDLRQQARRLQALFGRTEEDVILFINRSLEAAQALRSDSPVKIALRTLDQLRSYNDTIWTTIEPYLQRLVYHHSHSIDYVCLLVSKRFAVGKPIDDNGWRQVSYELIQRHLALNHHHEVVWLVWLMAVCRIEFSDQIIDALAANTNAHIRALLIAAYADGRITRKPPIKLGGRLPTNDENWLTSFVAKSSEFSGAKFSGPLSAEFQHLLDKRVKFVDFNTHMKEARRERLRAISRTRYGYDRDDAWDEDDFIHFLDDDD